GVTYTPELYCCGINYVGVSDLSIITSAGRRFGRSSKIYANAWVGPDRDARSPVNFVERIRVPTLHAYGENDPRVDIKNWTELESALKHYNKPYEFVREENEGHGFRHEEARIKFYQTMEAFLAKHLNRESGGDSLTVPPESRTAKSSQQ
ncbi:MAG TPA: prolyl oligopeptidase family serine peptidase, partial [Opitutaceae bacterium]|nr:prolyl oligopeptidase family serine peptidase [Opitutaceae bacterium]